METVNERRKKAPFAFAPIGTFRFEAGQEASVTISNAGADGFVAIDAVRFIPVPE